MSRTSTLSGQQLGNTALTAAWEIGTAISPDQAIEYALSGEWGHAPNFERTQDATAE